MLKGEFTFFIIRELDVLPLGESNLMGPKKSVEVKFFTVAFFGVRPTLLILLLYLRAETVLGKYARYDEK